MIDDIDNEVQEESQKQSDYALSNLLPEDLREDPSLKDFKDVGSLAKSYVHAQRTLGNSLRIPTTDHSKEDWDKFYEKLTSIPNVAYIPQDENDMSIYNKLGRPEDPNKYSIDTSEASSEEVKLADSFRVVAHKVGLTDTQVKTLVGWQSERNQAYWEDMNKKAESTVDNLKKRWGPDYANRMQGAKHTLRVYANKYPEELQQLISGPTGNNPVFLDMASRLAESLQEQGTIAQGPSVNYGMSAEEALDKIATIKSNNSHAYHNINDPAHKAAVEKVRRLYKIAYSE